MTATETMAAKVEPMMFNSIAGVKDATGKIERVSEQRHHLRARISSSYRVKMRRLWASMPDMRRRRLHLCNF